MKIELIKKYGNPDLNGDGVLDYEWFASNIAVFPMPFAMRLSWSPSTTTKRFQAHKLAGDRIARALSRMFAYKGAAYLRDNNLDLWGGCFNFRLVRGGRTLSEHSWGTAVDINPDIGRLGNFNDAESYPRFIVEAFEDEGFVWGGRWPRPDAMHYELAD